MKLLSFSLQNFLHPYAASSLRCPNVPPHHAVPNRPQSKYRIFSNLIRISFLRFLKRKKKLVRGSNPHLSFNRPLPAAPSEVARWVSAAWKAIPESIIVTSFKKCCISNALHGSEDDILWEDDGEDKDDSDWVTDNDSVMSDDGESDE